MCNLTYGFSLGVASQTRCEPTYEFPLERGALSGQAELHSIDIQINSSTQISKLVYGWVSSDDNFQTVDLLAIRCMVNASVDFHGLVEEYSELLTVIRKKWRNSAVLKAKWRQKREDCWHGHFMNECAFAAYVVTHHTLQVWL